MKIINSQNGSADRKFWKKSVTLDSAFSIQKNRIADSICMI